MDTAPTFGISDNALTSLSESSRACVERLRKHIPLNLNERHQPSSNHAAVLVLLYEQRASGGGGGLRVLLTTRSKELRSHPGQTALPGGKVEEGDAGVVETAFREANEEVALPLCSPHVHTLCTLEPFVSQYNVVVTPVVAFLDDVSVLEGLRAAPGEVTHIFDHPLEALLVPELAREEKLVPLGSEDWPYETDELHNFKDALWMGTMYRLHRFRSTASPVKGLTADILLATAGIAYAREPVYQQRGPGQKDTFGEVLRGVGAASSLSEYAPPPVTVSA